MTRDLCRAIVRSLVRIDREVPDEPVPAALADRLRRPNGQGVARPNRRSCRPDRA